MTTLIRDALDAEQGLYKISRNSGLGSLVVRDPMAEPTKPTFTNLNPERVDGKTYCMAPEASLKTNNAVAIPQLIPTSSNVEPNFDGSSSPLRKRTSASHKLVSDDKTHGDDMNALCQALISMLEQYPGQQTSFISEDQIIALQNEFQLINAEVVALEKEVAEQSKKLDSFNDNLNELLPRRGNFSPTRTLLANELIRKEESEIAELERELEIRSLT